jgi:hypothetical protein
VLAESGRVAPRSAAGTISLPIPTKSRIAATVAHVVMTWLPARRTALLLLLRNLEIHFVPGTLCREEVNIILHYSRCGQIGMFGSVRGYGDAPNELRVRRSLRHRSKKMARKATGKSDGKSGKGTRRSAAAPGTKIARVSSKGAGGSKGNGFDASEAFVKLLQSPLMAELVAVAATAALAALAEQGFTSSSGSRGKRAGTAVKAAGKAAAAAVGRRLSTEMEEIRKAAAKGGAKA